MSVTGLTTSLRTRVLRAAEAEAAACQAASSTCQAASSGSVAVPSAAAGSVGLAETEAGSGAGAGAGASPIHRSSPSRAGPTSPGPSPSGRPGSSHSELGLHDAGPSAYLSIDSLPRLAGEGGKAPVNHRPSPLPFSTTKTALVRPTHASGPASVQSNLPVTASGLAPVQPNLVSTAFFQSCGTSTYDT